MLGISAAFTVLALALAIADAKHLGKRTVPGAAHTPAPAAPDKAPDGAPVAAAASTGGPATSDAPASPDATASPDAPASPASKFDTFFERKAFLPSMAMLLVNIAFGTITTFIALHAAAQGVPQIMWYFIAYAVSTVVSRPFIGKIIDRKGYRGPSIFATLCTAATLVLIGFSSNLPMFCLAGVLGGLGVGSAMGTFQTMAVATVPPYRRGVATSTYMVFFDLGIAIGSFVSGVLAAAVGYTAMFTIMAAFPVLACLFFLVAGKDRLATIKPNAQSE
jgi:predicted MFS family arabinose efflux permease